MLTREVMGLLALAVLWVNTLLVVGAAWGPLRDLWARLGRMRALGVTEGEAPEMIAVHAVVQVGRRASDDADRKAILFHDRRYENEISGGEVKVGNALLRVAPASGDRAEVWVRKNEQLSSTAEGFDEAYTWASKARGFERRVESPLAGRVWIVGARKENGIETPDGAPLVVASFDPRSWCRRSAWLFIAFIVSMLAIAAAITYLALYPPLFGTVSIVGGALGLIFFLLVQPAGTAVRDALRVPSIAQLRGSWVQPSGSC